MLMAQKDMDLFILKRKILPKRPLKKLTVCSSMAKKCKANLFMLFVVMANVPFIS
jgi:hypothetical protein